MNYFLFDFAAKHIEENVNLLQKTTQTVRNHKNF